MLIPLQNFHAKIMESTVSESYGIWLRNIFAALSSWYVCVYVYVFPLLSILFAGSSTTRGRSESRGIQQHSPPPPFIISGFFFHLNKSGFDSSLWFFFLQRARSGPDYRVPHPRLADVRPLEMHWFSCCVTRQQSTFIWLFIQKRKRFFTTVEQCVFWIMLLRIRYVTQDTVHLPSLVWKVTSKKFQLVTHVQLPHTGDIQLQKKRQEP